MSLCKGVDGNLHWGERAVSQFECPNVNTKRYMGIFRHILFGRKVNFLLYL